MYRWPFWVNTEGQCKHLNAHACIEGNSHACIDGSAHRACSNDTGLGAIMSIMEQRHSSKKRRSKTGQ